ncbi:NmrA-like family protein [Lasiosphaeria hispida]|uniref:NmrA-like family protein n=1 Tax=Lasiosphaeria hispida TaxID=260671 RepID=A0AAJ0MEU6_9PEZI|nr:NmrA-like family protein [Lasiosphaeria hispida]
MVKIALAGGSGEVAHEIIDGLLAAGKHELTILSRKVLPKSWPFPQSVLTNRHQDATPGGLIEGTTWVKVDYQDKQSLVQALKGIHTVLSFIVVQQDPGNVAQINLIEASVEAGVKRLAPNEWASPNTPGPWQPGKIAIREHLKELNKDKKVLEYSLFFPGQFLNYLGTPNKTAKYLSQLNTWLDFANTRAILVEGVEERISYTTVQDLAAVVARAVEYEGEWPVIGGVHGNTITSLEAIALGEKIRGRPFAVERVKAEDIKAGELKSSWVPLLEHPAIPKEQAEFFSRIFVTSALQGSLENAWEVSDEWNRLLPDFEFTSVEKFLTEVWAGKP